MTVFAVLRDGRAVTIAAKHGASVPEVIRSLTADALTGSAVPLADAELETDGDGKVRYADVNTFEQKN